MSNVLVDDTSLTGIANAIRGKNGSQTTYKPSEMAAAITAIPSGGGVELEPKDVNFYDYDGTIAYSYTKNEFLALNSMPANPSHDGLTAQGWNWSFADATTYVTKYGCLNVGQQYTTSDGKTRIYIDTPTSMDINFQIAVNGSITIDWGDSTTPSTVTGTNLNNTTSAPHEYLNSGKYTMAITVNSGEFAFYHSNSNYFDFFTPRTLYYSLKNYYVKYVTAIEIGNNCQIKNNAFGCAEAKYITIPKTVTSIGSNPFISGNFVVMPENVENFSGQLYGVVNNKPHSINSFILPKNMTSLCIPSNYGGSIANYVNTTSESGTSVKRVIVPDSITSFGNSSLMLSVAYAVNTIYLSDNITSFGNSCFQGSLAVLSELKMPSKLQSIGTNCFTGMYSAVKIDFSDCEQVPTLGNNSFNCNNTSIYQQSLKIVVPDALYSTWVASANWSNLSSFIVKASEA